MELLKQTICILAYNRQSYLRLEHRDISGRLLFLPVRIEIAGFLHFAWPELLNASDLAVTQSEKSLQVQAVRR